MSKINNGSNEIVTKRIDILFTVEVKSNINGDPDSGGAPRECNGFGIATDKSIKRKIRDICEDHTNPVFIEIAKKTGIPEEEYDQYHILESMKRGFETDSPLEAKNELKKLLLKNPMEACKRYIDVRLFGCTFLDEQGSKGNKVRFVRSGVVQMSHLVSVAPISTESRTLTRKANTEDKKSDGGGMAPDGVKFVNHGIYVGRISVNPSLASRTGTTVKDIEFFKNILPYIFTATESTSRPAGTINILNIWWAEHKNAIGSFNANAILSSLLPVKKNDPDLPSVSLTDYDFPLCKNGDINIIDLMANL